MTTNLWIATICEQIWIVDITGLIKGLKVTDIDANKVSIVKYFIFYENYVKICVRFFHCLLLLLLVLLQIDGKRIESLLKQWLVERDDMSVMHSIYKFLEKV